MALSSECTDEYAPKVLDTADIVRDAIFHQLPSRLLSTDFNEPASKTVKLASRYSYDSLRVGYFA